MQDVSCQQQDKQSLDREALHQRWINAMRRGDFEAAWRETDSAEIVRRRRNFRRAEIGDLVWDGTSWDGKRVLIRCLHGLGDTLQFIRFVPEIAKTAASVTVAMQPDLLPLFSSSLRFGRLCNGWTDQPFE